MSVDRAEVERIAELAYLGLEAGEAERLAGELSSILHHMEVLAEIRVREPEQGHTADGTGSMQLSASRAGPDALRAPLEELAPMWSHGFFVVPPPPGVHDGADEDA